MSKVFRFDELKKRLKAKPRLHTARSKNLDKNSKGLYISKQNQVKETLYHRLKMRSQQRSQWVYIIPDIKQMNSLENLMVSGTDKTFSKPPLAPVEKRQRPISSQVKRRRVFVEDNKPKVAVET